MMAPRTRVGVRARARARAEGERILLPPISPISTSELFLGSDSAKRKKEVDSIARIDRINSSGNSGDRVIVIRRMVRKRGRGIGTK
jgi:hypothetical protein